MLTGGPTRLLPVIVVRPWSLTTLTCSVPIGTPLRKIM